MPYPAAAIANAFLDIGKDHGATNLTPMKLQKLVYFAHGWSLGATNNPLINEQVEAWQYGPVVRSIYDMAKNYGDRPVTEHLSGSFLTSEGLWVNGTCLLGSEQFSNLKPFLNWVWNQYGKFTGIQLSNITHEPGTPWYITKEKFSGGLPYGTDINQDDIRKYFKEKLDALQQ